MGNLWQFFGLPDPEGGQQPAPQQKPVAEQQSPLAQQEQISEPVLEVAQKTSHLMTAPSFWTGPVTPDGEPFHDLSSIKKTTQIRPKRALRYVKPDSKYRIYTNQISERVSQGDTVIVDLRPLVHMDSHQQACRRELRTMCERVGVAIFALDSEDKLLMIPGSDVVVERNKHELGITRLLRVE
jgi:SepF-like predicted cell division protein (DUF552 family)